MPALSPYSKDRAPACPYCGTTHGLRIASRDPRLGYAPDFICADCFTAKDDGPCFDDLEPSPAALEISRAAQAKARERVEYDDPFGYDRSRY